MKKLFVLFFFSLNTVFSQDMNKKNTLSLAALGHAETIISAHYERLFAFNDINKLYGSVGMGIGRNPGYTVYGKEFSGMTTLPIVASLFYGKKHFIHLKIGYIPIFSENFIDTSLNPSLVYKKFESDFSVSLGYKLMLSDGITLQFYPVAIVRNNPNQNFLMSFGIEMGGSW